MSENPRLLKKVTDKDILEIWHLRALGFNIGQIMKKTGLRRKTVEYWIYNYKKHRPAKRVSSEDKKFMIELSKEGMYEVDIQRVMGCGRGTVARTVKGIHSKGHSKTVRPFNPCPRCGSTWVRKCSEHGKSWRCNNCLKRF